MFTVGRMKLTLNRDLRSNSVESNITERVCQQCFGKGSFQGEPHLHVFQKGISHGRLYHSLLQRKLFVHAVTLLLVGVWCIHTEQLNLKTPGRGKQVSPIFNVEETPDDAIQGKKKN